jgi:hypothetical protein
MVRECQRFGVGLYTMESHYSKFRLHERLEGKPRTPADADVEVWLDYALSRRPDASTRFDAAMTDAEKQLRRAT